MAIIRNSKGKKEKRKRKKEKRKRKRDWGDSLVVCLAYTHKALESISASVRENKQTGVVWMLENISLSNNQQKYKQNVTISNCS